jgi:hypothetical protein
MICRTQAHNLLDSGLWVTHYSPLTRIEHLRDNRGDQYHGENAFE